MIDRIAQWSSRLARRALWALLALAALLPATAAQTIDFADFDWTFYDDCASVHGDLLNLSAGWFPGGPVCGEYAEASTAVPLPGTFTFDLHYDGYMTTSTLYVGTSSNDDAFVFPFCQGGQGCDGDVLGISVDVQANDFLRFALIAPAFFEAPARCTLSNLRFTPATGVSALGGPLSAAKLFETDGSQIEVLASLGDVNGDGRDDFAAGMPYVFNGSIPYAGAVELRSGRTGAVLHAFLGASPEAWLGYSLDGAGDLDGDGLDDLVVGEPGKIASVLGHVRVFSGATGAELFVLTASQVGIKFGAGVAGPGDLDGDGVGDIVVGIPGPLGVGPGAVQVYSGATRALIREATGDNPVDHLGGVVAATGDVDADGVGDYLATSLYYPNGADLGLVRVYSGASGAVLHSFVGPAPHCEFGLLAAGAGDFDGDGHADIVVGAPRAQAPPIVQPGFARVYSGATGSVLFEVWGTHDLERMGRAVAGAGDLDGDGFGEVLISAREELADRGRVLVIGGPSGTVLYEMATIDHVTYGEILAGGGDYDDDGLSDVVLTANTLQWSPRLLAWSGAPSLQQAPVLSASGSLLPGSPLTLALAHGPAAGSAVLVVGLDALVAPFKGGVLMPTANLIIFGLPLQPDGSLQLGTNWPAPLVAPVKLLLQAWCPTPVAAQGFVASNGLMLAPP